jgi:hypothetical protein
MAKLAKVLLYVKTQVRFSGLLIPGIFPPLQNFNYVLGGQLEEDRILQRISGLLIPRIFPPRQTAYYVAGGQLEEDRVLREPAAHLRERAGRLGGGPQPPPHHRDHVHGEVQAEHQVRDLLDNLLRIVFTQTWITYRIRIF